MRAFAEPLTPCACCRHRRGRGRHQIVNGKAPICARVTRTFGNGLAAVFHIHPGKCGGSTNLPVSPL